MSCMDARTTMLLHANALQSDSSTSESVCGRRFPGEEVTPMNSILEILNAVAAAATVAGFLLEAWREYKHRRMAREEKIKTGGNRS